MRQRGEREIQARKLVEGIDQALGVVMSRWMRQPTVRLNWPEYQQLLYLKGLDPAIYTEELCLKIHPIKRYREFRLELVADKFSNVMALNDAAWPEQTRIILTGRPPRTEPSRAGTYPNWAGT